MKNIYKNVLCVVAVIVFVTVVWVKGRGQYYDTSGKVTEEMGLEDAPWMDEERIWHTENKENIGQEENIKKPEVVAESRQASEKDEADIGEESGKEEQPVKRAGEMAYLIRCTDLCYTNVYRESDVERKEEIEGIPILLLDFMEQPDKEERINRLLTERYEKALPMEQEWLDSAGIRITYRSDRYLCFEYDFERTLPEGYKRQDLIFTLDVEKEQLVEYPVGKELYEEKREWQELPVEEQSERRGGTQYQLYESSFPYGKYSIPCIRIRGVEDGVLENKINEQLSMPLKTLLEAVPDERRGVCGRKFSEEMGLYVACQTEEYLSVVYSVQYEDFGKINDGKANIGITIDMKTGERVMLDDLFDVDEMIEWICLESGRYERYLRDDVIRGSVMNEEEYVELYEDGSTFSMIDCVDKRCSFYLYRGMIVIMSDYDFFDYEIPLPEVYEYLKVDPWY